MSLVAVLSPKVVTIMSRHFESWRLSMRTRLPGCGRACSCLFVFVFLFVLVLARLRVCVCVLCFCFVLSCVLPFGLPVCLRGSAVVAYHASPLLATLFPLKHQFFWRGKVPSASFYESSFSTRSVVW